MYHELHAVQTRIDELHREAATERLANEARRRAASEEHEPEGRVSQRGGARGRLLGLRRSARV
ncbi:hypothetical protein [Streptomyces sp. NPDC127098]|uniref:hypothetical protein n=1 Tax=Streptomyces sp. NPDC127098 TaxID=3347137 RepID=UPI0036469809